MATLTSIRFGTIFQADQIKIANPTHKTTFNFERMK